MKIERLFQVLVVVGGASIVGGCDGSAADGQQRHEEVAPDATSEPGADAARSDASSEELAPCFCDTQACCDRSGEPAEVASGFECCWGSSCP